ncbi:DUF7289 family protein [Halalkalicoccus jeotgali]|uniref:DUF7305 domain-containing protein n=1 Tax=Halalkalicoccus jeotgali (strain DSM 18796 / CECT 7217 / JCM 14584 / KCTC 4019 / B3) TaxID=795797 RepID=D8J4U5_HALJB|nr:collagen-binding domain-containing protein [Halalkalicoccus jeotgali]ADJ15562.1 hypothetical protein HacjB3_10895 [Halalkalicoccus jeotgali B3]ELY36030.1 hypothetical protein C497_11777 [Halalkalicoccus jeotgali B3]
MNVSRRREWRSGERGQSEVIGVVLVLSLTVIGATALAATGAAVLSDSQSNAQLSQAENAMSQMSSKASLVALGDSGSQSFDLGRLDGGTVDVREDAGCVTVYTENATGSNVLYSEPYGAVVATVDGTDVAYQGGGVWRTDGDGSVMVSPPEFHYRSDTLTFPIVRVTGEGRASGAVDGRFTNVNKSSQIYPAGNRHNPLEEGTVIVEIESEYYEAWGRFFDERTAGEVEIDHGNRTVRVELTVPTEERIENAVAVAEPNGITVNGPEKPEPYREGVQYPSADSAIDGRVEACTDPDGECVELTGETTITGEDGETTRYYASDGTPPDDLTVETNGGDVELVVDGVFEPDGLSVEGDGTVSVYVTEGFSLAGNSGANVGGDAAQLRIYLHSETTMSSQRGTPSFTGVLYAPSTDVDLSGNTDFEGALIAKTLHINGKAGNFEYDEALAEIAIEITPSQDPIRYLHVTDNEVGVELR